jgi:hypothetical protein
MNRHPFFVARVRLGSAFRPELDSIRSFRFAVTDATPCGIRKREAVASSGPRKLGVCDTQQPNSLFLE